MLGAAAATREQAAVAATRAKVMPWQEFDVVQFLSKDGKSLDWDKVIVSGASHGATTSARTW